MSNDQLQVLAFYLEMLGIGLAFLHVFSPDFSNRLNRRVHVLLVAIGTKSMDYTMPGVDYDESLSVEDRGAASIGYVFVISFCLAGVAWVSGRFDFGEGIFWSVVEVFAALIPGMLLGVLCHILFACAVQVLDSLCAGLGKGEYAASFGFILAGLGLAIEGLQINDSSLACALWLFPLSLVVVWLLRFIRFLHNL